MIPISFFKREEAKNHIYFCSQFHVMFNYKCSTYLGMNVNGIILISFRTTIHTICSKTKFYYAVIFDIYSYFHSKYSFCLHTDYEYFEDYEQTKKASTFHQLFCQVLHFFIDSAKFDKGHITSGSIVGIIQP